LRRVEKYHDSRDKPIMDQKNINRGFIKLSISQETTALHVLACKIFTNVPFELKKVASNSSYAFLIIIPFFHLGGINQYLKNIMISLCNINSDMLDCLSAFINQINNRSIIQPAVPGQSDFTCAAGGIPGGTIFANRRP